jgi:hypothetical protein
MKRDLDAPARGADLPGALYRSLVVILLLTLFGQLLFSAVLKSPTIDESNHLTRGYAYLKTGDLRLSRDEGHPPLYNLTCALPLLLMRDLRLPTDRASWQAGFRNAFVVEFLFGEGLPLERVFLLGRLPVMLTTLLLAALAVRWAGELYGRPGALLTLLFCAFDPNLIAHGRLITTDVGVTFAYLLAAYVFARFARKPSVWRLLLSGLTLGIAEATKFSALVLIPMLGLLGLIECLRPASLLRWPGRPRVWGRAWLSGVLALVGAMVLMLVVAGATVWAVYGFEVGVPILPAGLGWLPDSLSLTAPAPVYVEGLLKTVAHASEAGHPTFLMGRRSTSGWWWYFPVAFALKTPVPTLIALVGALISLAWRRLRWGEVTLLLVPAIYFGLSMGSALNIGYRHLLPMLPFLWVFMGRLGPVVLGATADRDAARRERRALSWPRWAISGAAAALIGWLVVGSLWIAPDYLAFFNELAGGPREGWRFLADSNLDWGQELWALDAYLKERGPERVHLSWFGCTYPHLYGRDLEYRLLPSHFAYPYPSTAARSAYNPFYPEPGLYVIGATNLNGVGLAAGDVFARFRALEPMARIGHSLFVYEVAGRAGGGERWPTCISGLRFKDLAAETNAASLGRGPGAVKWFGHEASFVLPGAGEPAYVLPAAPLAFAPAWQAAFLGSAEIAHRQVGAVDAGGRTLPEATVYRLGRTEAETLGDLIVAAARDAPKSWSPATVFDESAEVHPLDGPAAFEFGLGLVGYVVPSGASVKPGETLELITVWRSRQELPAAASELRVFVHVMDAESRVWGGEDRLDLHPPTWERDDLLVQYHRVPLPGDVPAGTYGLEVGVYAPITMRRLALYAGPDDPQPVSDRVLLAPITVVD